MQGPLTVLRDLWEDRSLKNNDRCSFRHVVELQDKLTETPRIVAQNADESASRYKAYFDVKSQEAEAVA